MSIEDVKELKALVNEFITTTKVAQEKDAEGQKEGLKKAMEDSTKAIEEINAVNARLKEEEKKRKEIEIKADLLEKQIFRNGGGRSDDQEDLEYQEKFQTWMRKGGKMDKDFVSKFAELHSRNVYKFKEAQNLVKKDLISGVNDLGGYWITPQRSSLTSKRIFETTPMRQLADIQTTQTNVFEMIIDDDEAGDAIWVDETQQISNTPTPKIGLLSIPIHRLMAKPRATQDQLDDAGFDVEGWLSGKTASKISRQENTAFTVGNGSKKPRGFLDYDNYDTPGIYKRDAVEQIKTGAAAQITFDGMVELQNSLKEGYQSNATFLMKRVTWGKVLLLKDGESRPLINPLLLKTDTDLVMLGKRVVFADDMPIVGASSLPIAYGDFREGYLIVDRFGFRVLRDEFTSDSFVQFKTTKRVGGAVKNFEAIKLQFVGV